MNIRTDEEWAFLEDLEAMVKELDRVASKVESLARSLAGFIKDKEGLIPRDRPMRINRKLSAALKLSYPV